MLCSHVDYTHLGSAHDNNCFQQLHVVLQQSTLTLQSLAVLHDGGRLPLFTNVKRKQISKIQRFKNSRIAEFLNI